MQPPWDTIVPILAAISPLLLALLGAMGWLYKHERERRGAAERQVSERKYNAYIKLLDIFFDGLKEIRTGQRKPERKRMEQMLDANKDIILFGSDDVFRIYSSWLLEVRTGVNDMEKFGDLIVAVRHDMGHPRSRITGDDILRHLITDYDRIKKEGTLRVEVSAAE